MNDLKFSIYTLGCKTNQSESDYIASELISHGFELVSLKEKPDFSIINTCTVTSASDSKARQLIRRIKKSNPEGKIIVTGCFIVFNEKFLNENNIDFVIGNEKKYNIPELVYKLYNTGITDKASTCNENLPGFSTAIQNKNIHSRALVKIQDGCEQNCSYCIVPLVRGCYRSVSTESILDTVEKLVSNGFEEIVLTGIHIGKYGVDSDGNCTLTVLLELILNSTAIKRIRLSSIEINELTPELIEVIRVNKDRIAPHLHMPLQSGSNRILELMNRPYTRQYFLDKIKDIGEKIGDIAITTDIIVGFPEESETDFNETIDMAKKIGFSKMHVFKFSPRANTPASLMKKQISEIVKSDRSHTAIKLGEELRNSYLRSNTGNVLEVLCEEIIYPESDLCGGTSGNYIKVYFKVKPDWLKNNMFEVIRGKLFKISTKELYRDGLMGKLSDSPKILY